MPRRAKPARLWLEPERRDATGRVTQRAVWVIRDGGRKISTGCGADALPDAERKLEAWIAAKRDPAAAARAEAADPYLADIISLWLDLRAERQARPAEVRARAARLLDFWGLKRVSEVTPGNARAYAKGRAASGARRELEDLRAALRLAWAECILTHPVPVEMPDAPPARERWLTRDEAAHLIWTAWRGQESQGGTATRRRPWRHIARFILVALYSGSRAGVVAEAAIRPAIDRPYVDLERGVLYRRAPGAKETKKRRPPAPIDPRLMAHLARWARLGISVRTVVEYQGAPVKRVHKAFRAVRERAGLGPDVTPHTLRHTAASWGMQNGCDVDLLAEYLGMTPEMLRRVYGHLHPDMLARAGAAIARRPGTTGTKQQPRQIPTETTEPNANGARKNAR